MPNESTVLCKPASCSWPFLKSHVHLTEQQLAEHPGIVVYVVQGAFRGVLDARFRLKQSSQEQIVLERMQPATVVHIVSLPEPLDALIEWGIDVSTDRITFPIDGFKPVGEFVPHCIAYGVLSPRLVAWCGSRNRFGANCLVQVFSEYPKRTDFQMARSMATHYLFPLLFLFRMAGVPCVEPEDGLDNRGLQCILFQPGTGENIRVHFDRDVSTLLVNLVYGEFGDAS